MKVCKNVAFASALLSVVTPILVEAQEAEMPPDAEAAPLEWTEKSNERELLEVLVEQSREAGKAEVLKEASDDKAQAAAASKEAAIATQQAQTAQTNLEALRAGKLIQYGISGGVAVAVQIPGLNRAATSQETFKSTSMPYLVAVPAYWGSGRGARRAYCAAQWTGTSPEDAARAVSRKDAEGLYEEVRATVQARLRATNRSQLDANEVTEIAGLQFENADREAEDIVVLVSRGDKATAMDSLTAWYAPREASGSCGWHKIGLWAGIPADYNATTTLVELDGSKRRAEREVRTSFAGGIAFIPNAYLSLLVGVTVGNLRQEDGDAGEKGTEHTVVAGTVALGGNLDLLSLLLP